MSKISFHKKVEKPENHPTEVNNEIFRFFELYQTKSISNLKSNSFPSNYLKKINQRKINATQSHLPGININSPNQNFHQEDHSINMDGELNKKNKYTKENNNKILEDSYLKELEKKRKAKLALLMIMNKYSGGEYCKDIKTHFDNIKNLKQEKSKKELLKEEEARKTFERQHCFNSFDNHDEKKFANEKFSDRITQMSSETPEFMQNKNKQNFMNLKLLNKNKLPKIVEENNDFVITKKNFADDLNEEQLADYYSQEEIDRLNNNFVSGKRNKKLKKETLRNLLINNRFDNSIVAVGQNYEDYINNNYKNNSNSNNLCQNPENLFQSPWKNFHFRKKSLNIYSKKLNNPLSKKSLKKVFENVNIGEFNTKLNNKLQSNDENKYISDKSTS